MGDYFLAALLTAIIICILVFLTISIINFPQVFMLIGLGLMGLGGIVLLFYINLLMIRGE